jgi:hypothetical protein
MRSSRYRCDPAPIRPAIVLTQTRTVEHRGAREMMSAFVDPVAETCLSLKAQSVSSIGNGLMQETGWVRRLHHRQSSDRDDRCPAAVTDGGAL